MVRYSFLVGLFHPLLHAGLSRRLHSLTLTKRWVAESATAPSAEQRTYDRMATIVSMECSVRFLAGLGLCMTAVCAQPFQAPASEPEKKESYEIYSTVLRVMHPNVVEWMIRNETGAFPFCSTPARDQDALYRPMLDDYVRKNKKMVLLERKFNLTNYLLVGSQQWAARSTNRSTIATFSVVGFNPERTRAAVCFWAVSSGTCSVLLKSDGAWEIDQGWRGDGCVWAY
jgi:hypothetical protein